MHIKTYWYYSGPLITFVGLAIAKIVDSSVGEFPQLYIPMHFVMLPALLMVWIGIMVTIATIGYGIVWGIRKIFRTLHPK